MIGLIHAALVTGLKLQPFLVTLCGLFVYRGAARMIASEQTVGLQTVLTAVSDQGNPETYELFKTQLECAAAGARRQDPRRRSSASPCRWWCCS